MMLLNGNHIIVFIYIIIGGYAIAGSRFGSGDIPNIIQNINCNGTEDSLTKCPAVSFTTTGCSETTVAGLICYGKMLNMSLYVFVTPELSSQFLY